MTDTTQTTETGAGSAALTPSGQTSGQTDPAGGGSPAGTGKPGKAGGDAAPKGEFWEGFTDAKLKESPVVLRHKSVEDLARSLTAAESKLGVPADQLLRLPTKPEETADLYRRLGAPETAEGYKIGLPENATDEDKAAVKSFTEHMHAKGPFPPDMIAAAVEWNNQQAEAATAAMAAAETARREEGEALLKKELGAKFDPEMGAVGKLLNDLGGPELAKELNASGAGDNPRLMLALHKIVDRLGEPDGLEGGNGGTGGQGLMTPGQAKAARIGLENDPVKGPALRDKDHAMHNSVVEERNRLFALEDGRKYAPPQA